MHSLEACENKSNGFILQHALRCIIWSSLQEKHTNNTGAITKRTEAKSEMESFFAQGEGHK